VEKDITSADAVLAAAGINPVDIQGEFTRIAALIALYNEAYAEALKAHLHRKAGRDRMFAARYLAHRQAVLEAGEKATEGVLKARVLVDKEYVLALERAAAAEVEKVRLGGVLNALATKRDALISLGAHLRDEMAGSPRVRGEERIDELDFSFEIDNEE